MDITRGSFNDFSTRPGSKSSRSHSRISSRGSMSCSMEILSPDMNKLPVNLQQQEVGSDALHQSSDDESDLHCFSSKVNYDMDQSSHRVRSSMSSHSTVSSSSEQTSEPVEDCVDANDFELEEAIKKMKKLDRILKKKIKMEREIKKQRLVYQQQVHADLEKLKSEKEETMYSDVESNTAKYLALLPPLQQLDVLLEKNESSEFAPIFQTQLQFNNRFDEAAPRIRSAQDSSIAGKQKANPEHDSNSKRKLSSAELSATQHSDKNKTDFIQRNIELAKDAGNFVLMTEDEKQRLTELLKDIEELEDNDKDGSLPEMALLPLDDGYSPNPDEVQRLELIDRKLQSLLSPDVFRSITSTPRSNLHIASQLTTSNVETTQRFLKSDLTETLNPAQRLNDIEEQLLDLDQRWRHQFSDSQPRLTDDQLSALLAECSRSTSPSSVTTSLQRFNLDEDDESQAISPRSTSTLRAESVSDFDTRSECSQDIDLVRPERLSREVLDNLLREAKSCLGLDETCETESVSPTPVTGASVAFDMDQEENG